MGCEYQEVPLAPYFPQSLLPVCSVGTADPRTLLSPLPPPHPHVISDPTYEATKLQPWYPKPSHVTSDPPCDL